MMNSFIKNLLIICLFSLLLSSAFAVQKTRIIGGVNGWHDIATAEGVTTGTGRFGYDCVQLETSVREISGETDLYLNFEGNSVSDATGHYEILSNRLSSVSDAIKGKRAALSRGEGTGISIRGDSHALFGQSGMTGSFTIECWLAPSIAENGETVFSWRSSRNANHYSQYQTITAGFVHNHLEWSFSNIFAGYAESTVTMAGVSTIIPNEWARHTLSFDQESGILEYCVNGKTEAIQFITTSGHENGTVCDPMLGVVADIHLCSNYTGKIDNFRIERRASLRENGDLYTTGNETYKIDGGRFTSHPILISQSASLDSVNALMNVPAQTDVRLYVRSGDNCWGWTDSYPAWKEVYSGEAIKGVSGLYFQVAAELLPDGGGMTTPSITQLELQYTEQPLPAAPFSVMAESGDGCVTLSWTYSLDDTAGGYYVYYGNRPGEYLGKTAVEGMSPIRAGNVTSLTLNGLKNGSIYYFAVSSYSRIDGSINGPLSQEVYARPTSKRGI